MTTDGVKRRLAAIMSADVKDYSRLMRQDETATVQTLTAYQGIMATLVEQHHGRVVDSPGDNLLAEFASVVDAVQGAVAIQKELKARNAGLPDFRKMEFRIGINLGDIIVEGDRIFGDGVNIAARLESLADPGGICISRTAYDQIEDKLPLGYEYLGEKRVKNISKPVRAYKVLLEAEEAAPRRRPKDQAGPWGEDRPFGHIRIEKRSKRRHRPKPDFRRHMRAYVGVIGLLLIIDLLTGGDWWFYWPALGWGVFLVLHRIRASTSPPRETAEPDQDPSVHETQGPTRGRKPKYLRVQIEPKGNGRSEKERVNLRIPLTVLRAGAKISAILPEHAKDRINDTLREKGIDIDLASLQGEKLDELVEALAEMDIDVDRDDKKIRIFCE
jgi:class 3 adenylate cyclase